MSSASRAACTIETAQIKMVEATNMMQVYNQRNIDFLEKKQSPPAQFNEKFEAFVGEFNALGVRFADDMETNTQLRLDDKVDQAICDRYDTLFETYAPADYQKDDVVLEQTTSDPDCNTNELWDRYGSLIQEQAKLTLDGKLDDAEQVELMRLSTELGSYATTDIARACNLVDDFEAIIMSK